MTVTERPERRVRWKGRNTEVTRRYLVVDVDDEADAVQEVIDFIPTSMTVGGVLLSEYEITADEYFENDGVSSDNEYTASVTWRSPESDQSKNDGEDSQPPEQTAEPGDEPIVSFTVNGEQITVYEALEQYQVSGGAFIENAEIGDLINFDGEEVRGTEIVSPFGKLTLTVVVERATVTEEFVKERLDAYGYVNDGTFRGLFPNASLRFDEFTMTNRDDGRVILTFGWSYRPTKVVTIGGETFTKGGWGYVWIRYVKEVNSGTGTDRVKLVPSTVHIAKVYEQIDMETLLP